MNDTDRRALRDEINRLYYNLLDDIEKGHLTEQELSNLQDALGGVSGRAALTNVHRTALEIQLDTPITNIDALDEDQQRQLVSMGVRYMGEAFLLQEGRSPHVIAALADLRTRYPNITKDDAENWSPLYWQDPSFIIKLNIPLVDGRHEKEHLRCKCVGDILCWRMSRGRDHLLALQRKVRKDGLWAACKLPPDWRSGPGGY